MSEAVIVCDAGPLIALSFVNQLSLLSQLYGQVLIPEAVLQEVIGAGAGRPGATELAQASWFEAVRLERRVEPLLALELGPGESEVISLAHHRGASLVLIDERRARRIAERAYGRRVKGSAGLLVQAKRAGLVSEVGPLLIAMRKEGYRLSDRIIHRACQAVNEVPPKEAI